MSNMANTTQKKTSTRGRKPAKPVVEESVAKELESLPSEIEKKVEEVKSEKKAIKKLQDDDMVMVASIKSGSTKLSNNEKPYDEYYWEKFGDVVEVRYGRLDLLRRKNGEEPFKTMLYILDKDAVEQLRLQKVYDNIGDLVQLEKIFALREDDFIRFVDNAPEVTKTILREIFFDKMQRKENMNFFSVQTWVERLDLDFDMQDLKR